jgi:Cu(I)/Ag(I) efflux system membrane fusion protein
MLVLLAVLISIVLAFKFCNNKPDKKTVEEKPVPLSVTENSGSFNESFHKLLTSYFALKDAFVASDTVKVNAAAKELLTNADSLRISEVKGDTSGTIRETAGYFASTISGSAKAILGEKGIEAKRNEFNMITDALWSLTRTVKYDGQKVYYDFCPMAFNNKGAYWLNDTREIKNPYFGSKMLNCGEVTDSLDYSKR